MTSPALRRAFVEWQRAAGPLAPLVNPAPFLFDGPLTRPRTGNGRSLAARLAAATRRPSLVVLDLPPASGLGVGAALNRDHGFAVAPIILRWPAERALLPSIPIASRLATLGARLRRPNALGRLAIVLDGERGVVGPLARSAPARRLARQFDNRYSHSPHLLPRADWLASLGVESIVLVSEHGIAPDLTAFVEECRGLEIGLSAVDASGVH